MQGLADDLTRHGYLVLTPDMPWSKDRAYDRSLSDAQQEIDAAMAQLRNRGATRLVIGGHSMGANMAISYAAVHPGLEALMAIGPGQTVEADKFAENLGESIKEAKALIAAGKGDTPTRFRDIHLGKVSWATAAPSVYLSYFDPEGLANMPALSQAINIPFLWTVGKQDKNMLDRGPDYAFALAQQTPFNEYDIVDADHMGTPEASRGVVLQWLGKVFPGAASTSPQ
jgi:pimeloyl-ACP methyl ester carboxylesterase